MRKCEFCGNSFDELDGATYFDPDNGIEYWGCWECLIDISVNNNLHKLEVK